MTALRPSHASLLIAGSVPNYSGKSQQIPEEMNSLREKREGYGGFFNPNIEGDVNAAAQEWQCIQKVTLDRSISSFASTMAGFYGEASLEQRVLS